MHDDLDRVRLSRKAQVQQAPASPPVPAPRTAEDDDVRQRDRLVRRLDAASARARRPSLTMRLGLGLASAFPALLMVFVGVVASLIWRTFYGSGSGSQIGWTAAGRQIDWLPVLVVVGLACGAGAVTFRHGRLLYVPAVVGAVLGVAVGVLDAPWAGKAPVAVYDALGRVEGFWGEWLFYAAVLHIVVVVAILRWLRRPLRPFRS